MAVPVVAQAAGQPGDLLAVALVVLVLQGQVPQPHAQPPRHPLRDEGLRALPGTERDRLVRHAPQRQQAAEQPRVQPAAQGQQDGAVAEAVVRDEAGQDAHRLVEDRAVVDRARAVVEREDEDRLLRQARRAPVEGEALPDGDLPEFPEQRPRPQRVVEDHGLEDADAVERRARPVVPGPAGQQELEGRGDREAARARVVEERALPVPRGVHDERGPGGVQVEVLLVLAGGALPGLDPVVAGVRRHEVAGGRVGQGPAVQVRPTVQELEDHRVPVSPPEARRSRPRARDVPRSTCRGERPTG